MRLIGTLVCSLALASCVKNGAAAGSCPQSKDLFICLDVTETLLRRVNRLCPGLGVDDLLDLVSLTRSATRMLDAHNKCEVLAGQISSCHDAMDAAGSLVQECELLISVKKRRF